MRRIFVRTRISTELDAWVQRHNARIIPERDVTIGTILSENTLTARPAAATHAGGETTTFAILVSLSVCHLLNDMNQSLVPALYPILKTTYRLDFGQVGLIALASQLT